MLFLKWKYIEYPAQVVTREELREKMRQIAQDDSK